VVCINAYQFVVVVATILTKLSSTGLWALKKDEADHYDSILVTSQVGETRIFLVGDEWEEGSLAGFDTEVQSLYCANVAFNQLLQVLRIVQQAEVAWVVSY
jgi:hypothetical protein